MTTCPICDHQHSHGRNFKDCDMRDLLSQAFLTGRIHAQRGSRCLTDRARALFGELVAEKYEQGYRYEVSLWA